MWKVERDKSKVAQSIILQLISLCSQDNLSPLDLKMHVFDIKMEIMEWMETNTKKAENQDANLTPSNQSFTNIPPKTRQNRKCVQPRSCRLA